jgi:hypothetical protein
MAHYDPQNFLALLCQIFGLIVLVAAAVFASRKSTAAVMAIPGVALLLFGNVDRIQSFTITAGSVKADLREIRQNVQENREILAEIRRLAVANAKLVIRARESGSALTVVDDHPAQDDFKARVLRSCATLVLVPRRSTTLISLIGT